MTVAEMAQVAMPYVYTGLWPVLLGIMAAITTYTAWGLPLPRAAMLGLSAILGLMAAGVFALSLTTGAAPLMSIQTYRPAIVSIRVAMFFAALVTLYALAVGLRAHWQAHRLAVAARHPKRE